MDCNEISCLTLKTKEIALDVEGSNLWINFAKILKCRDDVYINATQVAKKFKEKRNSNWGATPQLEFEKRQYHLKDYLRLEPTKRYQKALERFLARTNSPQLKHGVIYRRAGRYGGTWLHRKMFLNFARWLSPEFEIACDQIIEQVIMQADELKEGRDVLRKLQRPLNDVIKKYFVDTGLKPEPAVYVQFAVMIKRLIGCPDDRDGYTKVQLETARQIIEEYRAMIIHGKKTSLKKMNEYLHGTPLNLAWKKETAI